MQLVIQLAKVMGVHTVNVVRDRPNMEELQHYLKGLGADIVTTDDQLKDTLGERHTFMPQPSLFSCHSTTSIVLCAVSRICNIGY